MGTRTTPSPADLARLKLSPEVAHYLVTRGITLPDCPPLHKTPEAGEVMRRARFDGERVDRVLRTFASLRHTKGRWAGKPLNPDPWQVAYVIAPVFGWVAKNDRGSWVRVVREFYADVPRKNGKSTICGGVGIYLTCADGEQGAEVLAAATTEKQAGYVFAPIKQLAVKSPALSPYVKSLAKKVIHPATNSYFEVVSSVAEAIHGGNIHGAIIDELHVHATGGLVEAIETGTGSRDQPLIGIITTADDGKPNTIYARKRRYIEQLAARTITQASNYGVIWAAEHDDDPFAESTWRKANPGYGISPTREYLQDRADRARNDPAELGSFLRLHLGVRTRQVTRYIKLEDWDASAGMVDEKSLEGRRCHGGLDLASVSDLTALAWVFPPEEPGGAWPAIWRFWLPEAALPSLSKRTAGQADVWVREGWLRLTAGNVIDNDEVVRQIVERDGTRFDVSSLAYDRWGAVDVARRLDDDGVDVVPTGQGYASMSGPMKELLRLTLTRRVVHGGNPVMRWMIDNLAVDTDSAGNVKPAKDKAADKIDGIPAVVMALKECMATAETTPAPAPAVARSAGRSEMNGLASAGF